jgi:mono/diheme cytochrome c family protein
MSVLVWPLFKRIDHPASSVDVSERVNCPVARASLCVRFVFVFFVISASAAANGQEASAIFATRCSGCHTYGKGVRVGPDLKGVTSRRSHAWLLRFIRSSQSVIQSGDPTAVTLFRQFKQTRMPDHDLSIQQIESLLDYFASGGPAKQSIDERLADTATREETNAGRQLFHGEKSFAGGGQACNACHSVAEAGGMRNGTLGPDLTFVYSKYKDKALTSFLKAPCFPRFPDSYGSKLLTPQESFAVKAYLRDVSLQQGLASTPASERKQAAHPSLGLGSSYIARGTGQ